MPRSIRRRILIITFALLVGVAILEGVKLTWFPEVTGVVSFLFTLSAVLFTAAAAVLLDERIFQASQPNYPTDRDTKYLEADLLQLNRELEESTKIQTSELARLKPGAGFADRDAQAG